MYEHKTLRTNLKCQTRKKWIRILIYTEEGVHHFGYTIPGFRLSQWKFQYYGLSALNEMIKGKDQRSVLSALFVCSWSRISETKICEVVLTYREGCLDTEHDNITRLILRKYKEPEWMDCTIATFSVGLFFFFFFHYRDKNDSGVNQKWTNIHLGSWHTLSLSLEETENSIFVSLW